MLPPPPSFSIALALKKLVVLAEVLANRSVPCRSASLAFCLLFQLSILGHV